MPFGFNSTSRPLSSAEVVTDILQSHGENLMITAAIVKSTTRLTEDILTKALKHLLHYQPALRMKIFTELSVMDRIPVKTFVEMRSIDRKVALSEGSDRRAWLDIVQAELTRPMQTANGPLWKLCYMECPQSATIKKNQGFTNTGGLGTINEDSGGISAAVRPMQIGSTMALQPPKTGRSTTMGAKGRKVETNPGFEGIIIFKIHQVIADEVSLFDFFHSQFIPLLNALVTGGDTKFLKVPLKMGASVEEARDPAKHMAWHKRRSLRKSSTKRLKSLQSLQNPDVEPRAWLQRGCDVTELSERPAVACILPFAVMENVSKVLCLRCCDNQVQMSSAVLLAAAISLSMQARRDGIILPDELCMNFTVDLRSNSTNVREGRQCLGMWRGNGQTKITPMESFLSASQFWREVKEVEAGSKKAADACWELFRLQKEALRQLPKVRDISKLSGFAQGHMEVSVLDNLRYHSPADSQANGLSPSTHTDDIVLGSSLQIHQEPRSRPSILPSKSESRAEESRSKPEDSMSKQGQNTKGLRGFLKKTDLHKVKGLKNGLSSTHSDMGKVSDCVTLEEFYFMRSMSELSNAPLSLGVCVYRDRLMCTVTYNARWVQRSFATSFVDVFLRMLHDAVSEEDC